MRRWIATFVVLAACFVAGTPAAAAQSVPPEPAPAAPVTLEPRTPTGEYYLGRADAPVTVEMFGDFQCPACGEFARTVAPPFLSGYVDPGNVKFVWRDYAWIGTESLDAAQAARCAGEQGAFWAYHDYLFAHQRGENLGQFSAANLERFAVNLGLDQAAWTQCFDAGADLYEIEDRLRAGIRRGVVVTPAFLFNGDLRIGAPPYSRLAPLLDGYLARAGQ